MKKQFLLLVLVLYTFNGYSQTSTIDQLKKDNEKLKKENVKLKSQSSALIQDTIILRNAVKLCSLYNISGTVVTKCNIPSYKLSYIQTKGNRSSQKVEVAFMIEQNSVNQKFNFATFRTTELIDSQGNVYRPDRIDDKYNDIEIPTNVPVMIKLQFSNILPGTNLFKILTANIESSNLDYSNRKEGLFEVSNFKANWD